MAEMLLCDRLKELSQLIDQQHLLYLELDESPRKIDQREKLENSIKEYLCIAPHDAKFSFIETANVLHRSASTKDNFSGYKAALAWRAIGRYADNLVAQPWRKEYRDINLYCGFYKHEIEESLVGAELMFEAMGYRHSGHSTMALPDVLDPDRITCVSRDAIMAFVECQIMKQIWEAVSTHHSFTWLEILEFRENHPGTPDQAIRALTFKIRQRQHQEQTHHRTQQIRGSDVHHIPRSDCLYGQNVLGYYSHMHYPNHSYNLPAPTRYGPLVSPQQPIPPPVIYQTPIHPSYPPQHHILKAQEYYPSNGYHIHSQYPTPMNPLHVMHNGYSAPQAMYSIPSAVPTGQLIELDSTPSHIEPEMPTPRPINPQRYHTSQDETSLKWHNVPETVRNHDGPLPSGKAKDDGAGSWESWDYVYRNLESQGYKKDSRSRGDFLCSKGNYTASSQNNSTDIDISHSDLSDKMRKMTLESVNVKQSEPSLKLTANPNKTRTEGDGEARTKNCKNLTESEVDGSIKESTKYSLPENKNHRVSPEKRKRESIRKTPESASGYSLTTNKINDKNIEIENDSSIKELSKSQKSRENSRTPEIKNENIDVEVKWVCAYCTYLNSPSRNICEICCKSKQGGGELKPQPSGGQECSFCTLVNEPGLKICAVCNKSLENTPTYI